MSGFTEDELVMGIINALKVGDIAAVETMTLMLSALNPTRAQEIFDTMQLGLLIARPGTP